MTEPFAGFDLLQFWEDSEYARKSYVDRPLTEAMLAEIETELGVRLPSSYVALMRTQNGGIPRNCCCPTDEPTSWAEDHIAITGIAGVGREKPYSLCGRLGSKFMQENWGYPAIGICICDCPSAGHDMVMLDYRKCGPTGEPQVVHVDQERGYAITFLAADFESFIRVLVNESVYDTSDEDLEADLAKVTEGTFSTLLSEVLSAAEDPTLGSALRRISRRLTEKKGHFSLHEDPLSMLVYDLLFFLYSRSRSVQSDADYLKVYPQLLVFGDGSFKTGGYAPGFVEDWLKTRRSDGEIVRRRDGELHFTDTAISRLRRDLARFAEAEESEE